jgi:hypothetical protein
LLAEFGNSGGTYELPCIRDKYFGKTDVVRSETSGIFSAAFDKYYGS